MIVNISSDAEDDIAEGFWFYERQSAGLGDYFRSCIIADIDSLVFHGGIHEVDFGYHRSLSKRFPFAIYYRVDGNVVTVVAVLDARRNPLWIRNRLT
jgi:plasmid stabilization system protein ParE